MRLLKEVQSIFELNEAAMGRVRDIRYKLIAARTLSELLAVLVRELKRREVDFVEIILAEDVLPEGNQLVTSLPARLRSHLKLVPGEALKDTLNRDHRPESYIGPVEGLACRHLFDPAAASCVCAPMVHHGKLMGCLNLGSKSATRFPAGYTTDLLEDLAVTAALCIDNVIVHERNEKLATTDPLTGIHNRRYFFEHGRRTFALAQRHGYGLSCLFLDLNEFKPINDTYGHEAGDLVLKKVADVIQVRIRRTDLFARLGGDEFGLLLPHVDLSEALRLAEWLKRSVGQLSFSLEGFDGIGVSVSVGASTFQADDASLDDLVERADQAMYEDKGRSRKKHA
ncbi:MAG: sensor domain-containing diguanylate cyclase [Proteobacteria bacterium]|nr:sensor domain-containing diguanylate cyclase [Pseudomonadota bacterium]